MHHTPVSSREEAEPSSSDGEERSALIARVFREHNASLLRFLRARMSSAQDAREVAQEAYVRLLELHRPGAIGFLRAYLFKTAANLATDRLRHRKVVQATENEDFFGLEPPSPMETLAAQQDIEVLSSAMDELSAKCREVFMLRRLGNLSTEETARRMGISARMVRLYVAQALAHCHRRLSEAHARRAGEADDIKEDDL